jgi:beta-glucosidase
MQPFRRALFVLLMIGLLAPVFAAETATQPAPTQTQPMAITPEVQTASWAVKWWGPRHEQKLKELEKRRDEIKLLMIGDSITHGWENSGAKKVWDEFYGKRGAFNLGFSGDRTEQVVWRIQHGEVEGLNPKLAVIMIGTNNTGHRMDPPDEIAAGVKMIVDELRQRMPGMKILLLAIFPRSASPDDKMRVNNDKANDLIKTFADGEHVHWLNINDTFLTDDGTLTKQIMPDLLHPQAKGYGMWAEAMEPAVKKLMGED